MELRREPGAYWNPYIAGAALGIVLFLSLFITGNGRSASGGLARVAAFFEDRVAAFPSIAIHNWHLWPAATAAPSITAWYGWYWASLQEVSCVRPAGRTGPVETCKGPGIGTTTRLLMALPAAG